MDGQEKLLQRAEKKFENKVLEQIAQKIAIHQVELSTSLSSLESTCNIVTILFGKLCDISIFTKDIKEKLAKIDEDMKASAQQLHLDPSSNSAHFSKIRFLTNKQVELLREEARIRETLTKLQGLILPNMDAVQKHIAAHAKILIDDNNFSIVNHMIELSTEVQVALNISKVLQYN